MILNMYVIFDTKAQIYNKPFYFVNQDIAIRACQDLIDAQDNDIAKNPEDFSLFCIGSYDDTDATIELLEAKHHVLSFHELKPRQQQMFNDQPDMYRTPTGPNGAAMAAALDPTGDN